MNCLPCKPWACLSPYHPIKLPISSHFCLFFYHLLSSYLAIECPRTINLENIYLPAVYLLLFVQHVYRISLSDNLRVTPLISLCPPCLSLSLSASICALPYSVYPPLPSSPIYPLSLFSLSLYPSVLGVSFVPCA